MFKMKYTHNNTITVVKSVVKSPPVRDIINSTSNMNMKRNGEKGIGNMFERISGGNTSCNNCGGYKSAF